MSSDRYTASGTVDYDTVHSVGKMFLATLAVIWLLYLVSLLPGIDRLVPGTPVTFAAIAGAIATVVMVGLLLYLAPTLANLVRSTIGGPQEVVDDIASIVHLFVVLVAVLVAHRGLGPLIVTFFEQIVGADARWMYDILFFALALPPLAILAARVYVSLDPMAELLADRFTRPTDDDSPSRSQPIVDESPAYADLDSTAEESTSDATTEEPTAEEPAVEGETADEANAEATTAAASSASADSTVDDSATSSSDSAVEEPTDSDADEPIDSDADESTDSSEP